MTILERARELLARGFSVFPVPRPRLGVPDGEPGDGKTPTLAWKPYQTRLPTDDELVHWFRVPTNLAIATGVLSNLIVVDADAPDALRWCTAHLPYTPWQVQTARGFHLYYRHPGVPVRNRARLETSDGRLAIDIRGDGGYVIAAGSVHASGVIYCEAGDWTRDDVPYFWPGWLQRPARPPAPQPVRPLGVGDILDRARKYLAAIPRPEIGAGSDAATLYAACKLTRGFDLPASDAESLLWEWAGGRPGWTREWVAAKVQHAIRYGTEPIGALR